MRRLVLVLALFSCGGEEPAPELEAEAFTVEIWPCGPRSTPAACRASTPDGGKP